MASASSSAARSLLRDGKSVANLLFRARTATLTATETVQNNGPAIRSLLRLNQTPASQYPVFSETFPVMKSGFRVGFVQQEATVSERIGKMEAAHGKRVVDNEDADSEDEEETDFDEDEIDDVDIDDDEEFDDMDEDDDDEEEEEDDKYTRKKKSNK